MPVEKIRSFVVICLCKLLLQEANPPFFRSIIDSVITESNLTLDKSLMYTIIVYWHTLPVSKLCGHSIHPKLFCDTTLSHAFWRWYHFKFVFLTPLTIFLCLRVLIPTKQESTLLFLYTSAFSFQCKQIVLELITYIYNERKPRGFKIFLYTQIYSAYAYCYYYFLYYYRF